MRRRRLLGTLAGLGPGVGLAGCLTVDPPDRTVWHTPIGPDDPTDIAVADGVVAVSKAFETFGVETDGTVTWKRFDYGGPVAPLVDGFLALDVPNYHPRNAEKPAVLYRLAADGPVRWERPVGPLDGFVGMDADRARAYVLRASDGRATGGGGDLVVARALSDGAELWREELDAPARGPRVVSDTLVTVGDEAVGRDPVTGAERWRVPSVGGRWPPAVWRDRVSVTREEPPAVEVLTADGRLVNRYDLPGDRARGPLSVAGGAGIARTTAGAWLLDPATGADRRSWPEPAPVAFPDPRATLSAAGDRLVAVDERWGVTAVGRDGRRAWRVTVDGGLRVAAAGADGRVYAAGDRGLYALRE